VAAQGVVGVAERGGLDDAGEELAPVLQADDGGPGGDAANEAPGTVDGVEHPAVAGGAGGVAVLLAEEAVVGEGGLEAATERLLGLAVGDGDGGGVGLALDGQRGVEVAQGDLGGLAGDVDRLLVAGAPVGVHAASLCGSWRAGDYWHATDRS